MREVHVDGIAARGRAIARTAAAAKSLTTALVALGLVSTVALAQSPDQNILTYRGADRTEKLIDGAKQEGVLTYYSAMIVNQALRPLTAAFQAKYPFIKMAYWRADSEVIEDKLATEMRANNLVGDIIEGTGIGELAVQAGLAQSIWSPQLAGIPEKI